MREETGKLFCVVKFCCYCFHSFFLSFKWWIQLARWNVAASVCVHNLWPKITLYFSLTLDAASTSASERETENHLIFHYLHFSGFTGSSCLSIRPPVRPPLAAAVCPIPLSLVEQRGRHEYFTIWHYVFALPEILKYDDIVVLTHKNIIYDDCRNILSNLPLTFFSLQLCG